MGRPWLQTILCQLSGGSWLTLTELSLGRVRRQAGPHIHLRP